jgi:CHAT domain-containing protein
VKSSLDALDIDTLIFCMDGGLRQLPMAALHDSKQFLIENYSIGSIPSVSLTNTRYQPVKDAQLRLPDITIKAEALRQAQLAMLREQVYFEGGKLTGIEGLDVALPGLGTRANQRLSHPYYWAGFTIIGSPW